MRGASRVIAGEGGGGTGATYRYQRDALPVTAPGQTSFTLSYTPANPTDVELIVEGVQQEYGASKDFTVSGTTLTWNDQFTLDVGDWVEARYLREI